MKTKTRHYITFLSVKKVTSHMVKPCQASGAIQGMDPLSVWDNVSSLLNRVSTQPCRFMNSGGHCFVVFGRFEDIPITKPVFPFSDKTVVASPLGTSKISKFCTQLLSNARTNACVHVGNCIITGVSPGHHAESAMPGNALKNVCQLLPNTTVTAA